MYLHILEGAWSGWKRVLRLVGKFQASVLLTLAYIIFLPLIAIPYKTLADVAHSGDAESYRTLHLRPLLI